MTDISSLQNFVPRSKAMVERRSFITAAAIAMGKAVELNSSGNIAAATGDYEVIGIIDNMPDYKASEETGTVASGDPAQVVLFGRTFKGEAGGTFTAGLYVKFSAGKIIQTANNGTTASQYIALETATAAGQIKEYLVK